MPKVEQLSFARALTETRLVLRILLAPKDFDLWASIWAAYLSCCAQYRVRCIPDRQFARDRQRYGKKSRGLLGRRKGHRGKSEKRCPPFKAETRKGARGLQFHLS